MNTAAAVLEVALLSVCLHASAEAELKCEPNPTGLLFGLSLLTQDLRRTVSRAL